MKYDFEYMKKLYVENPQKFEEYVSDLIEDFMESLPENKRERYRAKQWRIEQELKGIVSPLERMNRMVSIFWDGMKENVKKYQAAGFATGSLSDIDISNIEESTNDTKIIDFKPKSE